MAIHQHAQPARRKAPADRFHQVSLRRLTEAHCPTSRAAASSGSDQHVPVVTGLSGLRDASLRKKGSCGSELKTSRASDDPSREARWDSRRGARQGRAGRRRRAGPRLNKRTPAPRPRPDATRPLLPRAPSGKSTPFPDPHSLLRVTLSLDTARVTEGPPRAVKGCAMLGRRHRAGPQGGGQALSGKDH
ncbi:hypothetical protein GGE65_007823 [Skermanella aerolata]